MPPRFPLLAAFALIAGSTLPTGHSAMADTLASPLTNDQQTLLDLSQQKWVWMAERQVDR